MSAGTMALVIVAAVIVLAAIVIAAMWPRMRTRRLRRRFGPEYDRTLARHAGDRKIAERDLEERLRRHRDLDLKPLPPATRQAFLSRWAEIQERFVDAPAQTVAEADELVEELLKERGYPVGRGEETMAVLSVHHAGPLQSYREARVAVYRARDGHVDTEELREALVGTRSLFHEVIGASKADDRPLGSRTGSTAREDGHHAGAGSRLGALAGHRGRHDGRADHR
ncbi:hypothetical protein GCM10027168_36530 [Streptomyces capparidis]